MGDNIWTYLISDGILLIVVIIACTFHECGHAYCAYLFGDDTAKNCGRLTLNPLKHLDPMGLICLIICKFGWAKPVPFNPYNFKKIDWKTGMLWVALAGPLANILLVFLGVLVYSLIPTSFFNSHYLLWMFSQYFIVLNANFAFFNLIPIPPLDGSKILAAILPNKAGNFLLQLEKYSFLILLLLIFLGIPRALISPLSQGIINAFSSFFEFLGIVAP